MARSGIRRLVEAVAARIPHFAGVLGSWQCYVTYASNEEECNPPTVNWSVSCRGHFRCDGDGPPQKYGCTSRYFTCLGGDNSFACGDPDPGKSYGCGMEGGLFNCELYEDKFTCPLILTFECYGGTVAKGGAYTCDYQGSAYHCPNYPRYDCDPSSGYSNPC